MTNYTLLLKIKLIDDLSVSLERLSKRNINCINYYPTYYNNLNLLLYI